MAVHVVGLINGVVRVRRVAALAERERVAVHVVGLINGVVRVRRVAALAEREPAPGERRGAPPRGFPEGGVNSP
ncbi:hypothetical protein ACFV90_01990 [Streptomyces sp. NPDC059904]|uniref:hypothetical protein n=1 Tax=unclassified Streptomyces TaxID=2593676 RepID=UPI0036518BD9